MTPPPGERPEQPSLFDTPAVEEPWWVRSPASPLDVKRASWFPACKSYQAREATDA